MSGTAVSSTPRHASSFTRCEQPFKIAHHRRRPFSSSRINHTSACHQGQGSQIEPRSLALYFRAAASGTAAMLLAFSMAHAPVAMAAESFQAVPRVVDGDTLEVDGIRVRLYGIDAPESKQSCRDAGGRDYPCGQKAAELLKEKLGAEPVRCDTKAKDQYGRRVAVCRTKAFELNEWLVSNGLAVAYRQYGTEYVGTEDTARAAKRGIWAGQFDIPSDWRKERKIEQLERSLTRPRSQKGGASTAVKQPAAERKTPSKVEASAADTAEAAKGFGRTTPTCPNVLIKGNISAKGEKIYHMPGSRAYTSVVIEPQQGERYFCSEAEAQAAGWRVAK